jgi:hypothetical protein
MSLTSMMMPFGVARSHRVSAEKPRCTETMGKMQDVSHAVQRVAESAELRNAKSAIFTRAGHPPQRFATIRPSQTHSRRSAGSQDKMRSLNKPPGARVALE